MVGTRVHTARCFFPYKKSNPAFLIGVRSPDVLQPLAVSHTWWRVIRRHSEIPKPPRINHCPSPNPKLTGWARALSTLDTFLMFMYEEGPSDRGLPIISRLDQHSDNPRCVADLTVTVTDDWGDWPRDRYRSDQWCLRARVWQVGKSHSLPRSKISHSLPIVLSCPNEWSRKCPMICRS
jgi:hypothetical protein